MKDPFFEDAKRLAEKAQQIANENLNRNLLLSENAKLRDEIHSINLTLKTQIDDAKKSAKTANIRAWISLGVSFVSVLVSVFLAIFL